MKYFGAAVTDIGIKKETNQDSVCMKIAETSDGKQVVMVMVCDGMGGLEKGELASATVIRKFSAWFANELPRKLVAFSWQEIAQEWTIFLKKINQEILQYGKAIKVNLGTTVSVMLIVDNEYMIAHVGDSRVYRIDENVEQITEDQTFIAREMKRGTMTLEEAMRDKRRNMLLQCVGSSRDVEPDILFGKVKANEIYMLCSDGFRHKVSNEEIHENFYPRGINSPADLERKEKHMVAIVKARQEKDNISVVAIKCTE